MLHSMWNTFTLPSQVIVSIKYCKEPIILGILPTMLIDALQQDYFSIKASVQWSSNDTLFLAKVGWNKVIFLIENIYIIIMYVHTLSRIVATDCAQI